MSQKNGELEVSWADQVYGFWVKRIICLHSDLTRNYNLVQDPDSVPDWLSKGITTLYPKNDKTDQAEITGLSRVFLCSIRPSPQLSNKGLKGT